MSEMKIDQLLAIDSKKRLAGMIDIQDLVGLGIEQIQA